MDRGSDRGPLLLPSWQQQHQLTDQLLKCQTSVSLSGHVFFFLGPMTTPKTQCRDLHDDFFPRDQEGYKDILRVSYQQDGMANITCLIKFTLFFLFDGTMHVGISHWGTPYI